MGIRRLETGFGADLVLEEGHPETRRPVKRHYKYNGVRINKNEGVNWFRPAWDVGMAESRRSFPDGAVFAG